MAPLGGLTVELKESEFRHRAAAEAFTVAFIGRMARQKAPEVFVAMAQRLRDQGRDFRFIMHGDGEMTTWVDDLIRGYGLADIVRRDSSVPVSQTLDEAHVLVVTSHNEGLTLTTLEAIAHGVPVVSTDVGAQSDIVPRRALVSRKAHRAVARGCSRRRGARRRRGRASRAVARRAEAEKKLSAHPAASTWFAKEVQTW